MTLTTNHPTPTDEPIRDPEITKSRRSPVVPFAAAIAVLLLGLVGWYFLLREVAPAEVDSVEAATARSAAAAEAGAAAVPAPASEGLSGVWTVDTTIGQFNDACLTEVCSATFAGFRIDEVLTGIGDKTVVGRTPGVEGRIAIEGTVVTGGEFIVDMTGLITDSGARTSAMRGQAIETASFPTATFELTAPIDLGRVPGDGDQVNVNAAGNLTVHGVTRALEIPLTAELQSGVVVIFGQLEVALADYDIDAPSAPVVVSVEDTAILELQLFLTR